VRRRGAGQPAKPGTRSEAAALRRTALRLGAQAGLTVAAIVALLVGVAVLVVLHSQQIDAQSLVRDTANRADDVNDPPSDVWMVLRTPTGQTATRNIPPGLPDRAALDRVAANPDPAAVDVESRNIDGRDYLIRTQRRPKGVLVQVALDRRADYMAEERLLGALVLSGGLGLVLAALAGAWLGSRAVRPLSDALALQRRFVSDAGHELRTPLTLLSTRAQLLGRQLRGNGTDPRVMSDVDGLVADSRNLADILEDLLLAADPAGQVPVEPVDLGELATRVAAASTPDAAAHGVELTCPEPGRPVVVLGAPAGLRRALTALVDNAIRHARGRVTLAVTAQGGNAVAEVRDDGTGIDPDLLPRLFERFASSGQVADGRRRYGLGLALVSEIAGRHGGSVAAHNAPGNDGQPGSGAVLRITLPLAETARPRRDRAPRHLT
jgi:two-component system, OmpR family, sensor kinase